MNKKHFLRGLALTLFALVSPTLWAYDFEVDGIYYETIERGGAVGDVKVVKNPNSNYEGDITIPNYVHNPNNWDEDYFVIRIDDHAFEGCSYLNSITISSYIRINSKCQRMRGAKCWCHTVAFFENVKIRTFQL